jgi:hypothetical protein
MQQDDEHPGLPGGSAAQQMAARLALLASHQQQHALPAFQLQQAAAAQHALLAFQLQQAAAAQHAHMAPLLQQAAAAQHALPAFQLQRGQDIQPALAGQRPASAPGRVPGSQSAPPQLPRVQATPLVQGSQEPAHATAAPQPAARPKQRASYSNAANLAIWHVRTRARLPPLLLAGAARRLAHR